MPSDDPSDINAFFGDILDVPTFEQILEMDDDEDERDFSKQIVLDFFDQVRTTFVQMDEAIQEKELTKLSELGHFLKGSSATIGLNKVKDGCEKIQNWGSQKDEAGNESSQTEDFFLARIKDMVPIIKSDCAKAEARLRKFYSLGAADK